MMKLLTQLRDRSNTRAMQDRLVWQAASLLLAYPDDGLAERLGVVDELVGHIGGSAAALLQQTAAALRGRDQMGAAMDYVATFDMRRRATMYLTYWTAGDTRNRGREMLEFATAYRNAGVQPPRTEAPDHLPVVLEFAATVDPEVGRRLLSEHRVPIDVLRSALADAGRAPCGASRPGRTARGIRWAATVQPDRSTASPGGRAQWVVACCSGISRPTSR